MEKISSYKNYTIKEGPKPGSKKFQYYFTVYEKDKKKAHFCVWVEDAVLKQEKKLDKARGEWFKWVTRRIDEGGLKDTVLKIVQNRIEEIDLNQFDEKIRFE
jgi:hypothetical protein